MPVINPTQALASPPSNAWGLVQYVAQRIPGYDFSEYLRELNAAYVHVWEEVSKLGNYYFTNIQTVTVAFNGLRVLDLQYNANAGLSGAISSRLYQIMRVRCQPPSGGLFQSSYMMHLNDPDFISVEANMVQSPTQTGPYYFVPVGHGSLRTAIPLASGTTIEVTYTYWPIALQYLSNGTVTSAGSSVTGATTTFTQLVPPDFQPTLPATVSAGVAPNEEFIQAELICNSNQIYRVATITGDTALTTLNTVAPALAANSPYILATVPEIPREHIRVIASIAIAKMYSVAGDDQRVQEWTAISTSNLQMMKDSLVERQQQQPPRKQRFQYGVSRRNRAFLR